MRSIRKKLLSFILAAAASLAAAGASSAQETVPAHADKAAARRDGGAKPAKSSDAEVGARAQRAAETRQRTWDRKMKSVSGSICRGC